MNGSVNATNGSLKVTNNVIIESDGATDSMFVNAVTLGSVVQFNTFVNTTAVTSDGVALACDDTVAVSSNIFAYNSMHPMGPPSNIGLCNATFSLFDSSAVAEHTAGTGNQVADVNTFFVDKASSDFHLASSSPAKEAAEPGLGVTVDFEGNPRPSPANTEADIGALEAP